MHQLPPAIDRLPSVIYYITEGNACFALFASLLAQHFFLLFFGFFSSFFLFPCFALFASLLAQLFFLKKKIKKKEEKEKIPKPKKNQQQQPWFPKGKQLFPFGKPWLLMPLLTSPSYKVTSPKVMLEGDVTLSSKG